MRTIPKRGPTTRIFDGSTNNCALEKEPLNINALQKRGIRWITELATFYVTG